MRTRLVPDSLTGWIVLLLLVVVLVSQGVAFALYSNSRRAALEEVGGRQLADRIASVVERIEAVSGSAQRRQARALSTEKFRVVVTRRPLPAVDEDGNLERIIRIQLLGRLGADRELRVGILTAQTIEILEAEARREPARLDRDRPLVDLARRIFGPDEEESAPPDRSFPVQGAQTTTPDRNMQPPPPPPAPAVLPAPDRRRASVFARRLDELLAGIPSGRAVRVGIRLDSGAWLGVLAPLEVEEARLWQPRFAVSLSGLLLLVILFGIWAARRASQPFADFAAAAERLGKDMNAAPLDLNGPREAREAARAFNRMQRRLHRFIEDRTRMLAAISHDLRTPITRLRLRAELLDDEAERDKMLVDLEEMEQMISATLSFARDDGAREETESFDLAAMVGGLCADLAGAGHDVTYEGPEALPFDGRRLALKRAVSNVVENALKYAGMARVVLADDGDSITLTVEDDGPGIPEAEQERVFAPFYRIEGSRSRETGGTGLGLTVVRSMLRGHGGDVTLENRPEGGLRVRLLLPRGTEPGRGRVSAGQVPA